MASIMDLFGADALKRLLAPSQGQGLNMLQRPQFDGGRFGGNMLQSGPEIYSPGPQDMPLPDGLKHLLDPAQTAGNFLTRPDLAPLLSKNVNPAPQVATYQPTSQPAPAPQPSQAAAPVQAQGQEGTEKSFMGGLNDFFTPARKATLNDFFTGLAVGQDWQSGIALGAANVAQNKSSRQQKNQTVDFLKGKGLSDEEASQVASNPAVLSDYLKGVYAPKGDKLVNAGGSLYNQETGEWITPPAGAGKQTEYGLQLIYAKDPSGKTVGYQLSKDGTAKQFDVPDGVELTPGVSQVDTGTATVLLNNKTGERVGTVDKDVAGAAQASQGGKNTAEAVTALPGIETAANVALSTIDSLKNDPYLPSMVGSVQGRLPNLTSDAARVQGKMDQLQGQAFLQAFNSLKGGGAITETEGTKAEAAIARLNTAQNESDYNSALTELRGIIEQGVATARKKAGGGAAQAPSANKTSSGIQWSVEP